MKLALQNKKDKLKEVTGLLEQGIKDVFSSEHYVKYLSVMSKFHSYSYRNSILIMLQKPDATHVAGFNSWKTNFKRFVNKGEKGIQILAPAPYRIKVEMEKIDPVTQKAILDKLGKAVTEEVEIVKPAFKPVYVFDVSQTSGEPLPKLTTELDGNVLQYNAFLESLKSVSPYPLKFEDIKSGAKGYCSPTMQQIVINTGMSEVQNIKTIIHEITHADLHSNTDNLQSKNRNEKEIEAESVAFVVCNHYGIDTSDYSFAYLASWSSDKELSELKSSLNTIQKQAADLINRIDERFQELLKQQTILPKEVEREGESMSDKHEERLINEHLDSVRFDNDIDLDKERTREQLGFKEYEKPLTISERMATAKEIAKERIQNQIQNTERSQRNRDLEER